MRLLSQFMGPGATRRGAFAAAVWFGAPAEGPGTPAPPLATAAAAAAVGPGGGGGNVTKDKFGK